MQTSLEWPNVEAHLREISRGLRAESDINKFIRNLYPLINDLSKSEILLKHNNRLMFQENLEKINSSIDMIEEFILISKLSE